MSLIFVEEIRGRCASFMIIAATVSEIFGGQTNSSILVLEIDGHLRQKVLQPGLAAVTNTNEGRCATGLMLLTIC